MQIVIIGLGQMGYNLAEELDREGHDVTSIEPRADRVEIARTRLDVMAIRGSGCSRAALIEASAEKADLIVAASGSDEVNIVSCLIGRELGVKHRIARIESSLLAEEMHDLHNVLGVDEYVSPRQVAVDHLKRTLTTPGATESAEFAGGRILLRGFRVEKESELTSAPLAEASESITDNFRVAAVRRGEQLIVPTGNFQIKEGDFIYVAMKADAFESFLTTFRLKKPPVRRIVISGASEIGMDLCRELTDDKYDVVLIEEDLDKCEEAAELLPRTSVIHGQPLDRGLMLDLKVNEASFLSLSKRTDYNFASAVAAKYFGAKHAIMLASMPEEVKMFERPPIDSVVNPISLSVGAILRSVRAGRVIYLLKLAGQRAEALEIIAEEGAPGIGKELRDMADQFPKGAVIAAVEGKDGAQVATGETVIQPGDHIIAVALNEAVPGVVKLFSAPREDEQASQGDGGKS